MKKTLLPLLALITATVANAAEIKVSYENLDKFTDFTLSHGNETDAQVVFERELDRSRLQSYVGEDRVLELNFTDIDMAGDIQPWRNRDWSEIRYVEAIYPPRAKFTWVLRGADGAEIASGEENLRDLGFDMNLRPSARSETFRYEIDMLESWARKTLPRS